MEGEREREAPHCRWFPLEPAGGSLIHYTSSTQCPDFDIQVCFVKCGYSKHLSPNCYQTLLRCVLGFSFCPQIIKRLREKPQCPYDTTLYTINRECAYCHRNQQNHIAQFCIFLPSEQIRLIMVRIKLRAIIIFFDSVITHVHLFVQCQSIFVAGVMI